LGGRVPRILSWAFLLLSLREALFVELRRLHFIQTARWPTESEVWRSGEAAEGREALGTADLEIGVTISRRVRDAC